jgi:protein-S-isoprenylcysteine O-methyltransferase Ste14
MDRITLIRAGALYAPLCSTAIAWLVSPPTRRERATVFLATAWNVPMLLAVHVAAMKYGWWSYDATDATIAGFPVDLYIGWAILWGALPALVARRFPIALVVAAALALDVVAMPRLSPVVRLGETWWVGEALALATCLLPAQLLAAWTRHDVRVRQRAVLQVIAFSGIALGVLPQIILQESGGSWAPLLARPRWLTALYLQLLGAAALLGVSAVQEFAVRGRGTPVPFDPPKRLVTSGPYAYVRNPMQLSAALVLIGWGALLGSWWVVAAGAMAVIYGAGFATGDERVDLERRFGVGWTAYAARARRWIPRWRPANVGINDSDADALGSAAESGQLTSFARSTLYVAEECGPCSGVRRWFSSRSPVGLDIVAAERHPSRSLTRITYDPGDGTGDSEGVAAIGRALEHVHFGWAMLGMFVRLAGVCAAIQLVTDASGGNPRRVVRYCDRPEAAPVACPDLPRQPTVDRFDEPAGVVLAE